MMGGGISGSAGDTGSGDSIGGSGGEGIWGSGDDHGESGDDGGVDIARSLATSASDQTGVGTGAGIEILAVMRYARCGGSVAGEYSSVLKRLGSPQQDGAQINSW
ncbi:hypothetical protein Tco_0411860 [Tanacetum coccineum]